MKHLLPLFITLMLLGYAVESKGEETDYRSLPHEVYSGPQGRFHVQGIAYDARNKCFYMSFTTSLIKVDMQGRLIGSVVGLTGHLGCISLNPDDGRLYASNEYKHDAIGSGITQKLGKENSMETGFYVCIFDVDRITRPDMDASEVMTSVYISEAVADFEAKVTCNGKEFEHRHACSGIDGLTLAPAWGKGKGRNMLYVAYGVYADEERTDNDYQVVLCYDISKWKKYEQPLSPTSLHRSGPDKPARKYFVYTGNTNWGIQNLAYDRSSGNMYAAVYPGQKAGWPCYSLFVIDGSKKPVRQMLKGFGEPTKGYVMSLLPQGIQDTEHGTWGWHFRYGTTGLCPVGNGYFYISHNRVKDGREETTLRLYKWTGNTPSPFFIVQDMGFIDDVIYSWTE